MRRRTWISLAVALAVIAALATAVYLRKKAPPEVARLLPEADAIVYLNLKPVRALAHFDQHPVPHDPEYQSFIDATGIVFERDLDHVAFAIHRMADPSGPNGAVAYSEVFQGRFSGLRLTAYLEAHSSASERYAGHDIYSLTHDGRTVRVVLLGYDLVAVSNAPTAEQIHSMIDRYHVAASPFTGDTLLTKYYSKIPLLSEAWGIGELGLPFGSEQQIHIFNLPISLPADSTFIASIRYLRSIHLRLEEIAPTEIAAKETVSLVKLALGLVRSAQVTSGAQDATAADWNALLRSVTIKQQGKQAILQAAVPTRLVRSLLSPEKGEQPAPTVPENNPVPSTP